jgi:oligopeptide/dipeptide ABC transporter ATP-binding protein
MTDSPLLEARGIVVEFRSPRRGLTRLEPLRALDQVDLEIHRGETVGLVGESGSGKSTLARVILGLQPAISGTLTIDGQPVPINAKRYPKLLRRQVQVVFQDPFTSLNPSMSVAALIGEGLALHGGLSGEPQHTRVNELLEAVKLPIAFATRRPNELSGGQRQRVALARAIAVGPSLLLLDEPVSSLDATTRREIVTLLAELQQRYNMAYLFVGHDLGLISEISDRTVVLYRGKVMEAGPSRSVWGKPAHPYTDDLLSAVPIPDPLAQRLRRQHRNALGDVDRPAGVMGGGCSYSSRCRFATEQCANPPHLLQLHSPPEAPSGVAVACHHPLFPESQPVLHSHFPTTISDEVTR